MADEKKCPHCGKPVPPTAPGGICPECMLKAGLATQTEGPGQTGPHGTKVVLPLPKPEEIAPLFPQLEILECLGRGGMGVVYKARQPRLNRLVALKILAREKEQDAKFAERFTREAQALARLNHPNIVTVHDFGEVGGHCYLVMEFVDGLNLRQLLQTRKMPPEQALTIVPKICEALQYAHEQGIVHRDIKPENILLDKSGRVKIADFGIAKMLGGRDALPRGPTRLTEEGHTIGTPHYMAPEQIEKPLTVDHRADIYSLGVVFYEMLTGELPLGKFQPPSKKIQIDVRLDEVVLHALEKEPERRYQQASQVKTAVETIAATTPGGPANQEGSGAQIPDAQIEAARKSLKGPARGLIAAAVLQSLFGLGLLIFGIPLIAREGGDPMGYAAFSIGAGVLLVFAVIVLFGAASMMKSRNFTFSAVASVVAAVAGPGAILGLPFGVWALVVLNRREVRTAFEATRQRTDIQKLQSQSESRLSGIAIIGATWMPFFWAAILFITLGQEQFPQCYGGFSRVLLFLCLAAPVTTTILGWLAVAQIRRSAGSFRGMELAVIDSLIFPLPGVDLLIGIIWLFLVKTAAHWRALNGSLFLNLWEFVLWTLLLVVICAVVDFLIARYIWRAINQPTESASAPIQTLWARTVLPALTGGLLTVGVISFTAASLVLCCRNVDNVNQPFVDDPQVIGHWKSVYFVDVPDNFSPGVETRKGDLPVFQNFAVYPDGRTSYWWLTWTKGAFINKGEKTAAGYEIRNFDGTNYLFVEWKNADYILFHSKPWFYVLRATEEASTNFYIGQADFPQGDSIEITSVERTPERMTVKGRYNLVSHDKAELALYITSTNKNVPEDTSQRMGISEGSRDFELIHSHLVPGWPHVSMYANGGSFAALYFGTKEEAAEESKLPKGWSLATATSTSSINLTTDTNQNSTLQFRLVLPKDSTEPADDLPSASGNNQFHLSRQILLDDAAIARAGIDFSPDGRRKIEIRLTDAGAQKFETITANNLGRQLAIVFRGQVLSAPVIQFVIPNGKCQVDGPMNTSEIYQIVDCLNRPVIPTIEAWKFSPIHERILPLKAYLDAAYGWLDLDSGTVLTNSSTDWESRSGYEWIRRNGLDVVTTGSAKHFPTLLGVDMLVAPAPTNGWEIVTTADIVNNWALLQQEPQSKMVFGVSPGETDTFFFQTREGGKGILQILGFADDPPGVKLRYKLVQPAGGATNAPSTIVNQVLVEHAAMHVLAAIRDKDDAALKDFATDERVKGWRESLPEFAFELREKFHQFTGKPFDLHASESQVRGNEALVKCDGPAELNGKYLALFLVKTTDGWKNCYLHSASLPSQPLEVWWEEFPSKKIPAAAKTNVEDATVSTAEKWLALVDAGNNSESWQEASAFFRGAVTEPTWENSMNTFRKPLGDLLSRELKSAQAATELPGAPDGQYVVMLFQSSFANKKSAIETVTFTLEKDGNWKAAGYYIK